VAGPLPCRLGRPPRGFLGGVLEGDRLVPVPSRVLMAVVYETVSLGVTEKVAVRTAMPLPSGEV
jgi:hypothetical protein